MAYVKTFWKPKGVTGETEITDDRMNNLETQYDKSLDYTDAQVAVAKKSNTLKSSIQVVTEDPEDTILGQMWLIRKAT